MLRKIGKGVLITLAVLTVVVMALVTTLDMTPYHEMSYYKTWKKKVAEVKLPPPLLTTDANFSVGYAKTNITPPYPTPMAGYGNRQGKDFEAVHDSIYSRTVFITNGRQKVAIVSLDMLIVPPTIYELVVQKMKAQDLSDIHLYMNATHSHNSVGGWYDTLVGKLFAGSYNPAIEQIVSDGVVKSIIDSQENLADYSLRYEEDIDLVDIRNRLIEESDAVDAFIRSLIFTSPEKKIALTSYAAHATVLDSKTLQLSRDYAGVVVDSLEKSGFAFAQFMAGAVGSMGPRPRGNDDFDEVNNEGISVVRELNSVNERESVSASNSINYVKLTLPLRKASPKLNQTFALRPWVFSQLFGDSGTFVTALQLGNNLLIGLPCDFSGELMKPLSAYAKSKGLNLIVTSFNGGYIGYVTADEHFTKDTYETVTMNWFGPYNGAYFSEITKDLIDVFSQKRR